VLLGRDALATRLREKVVTLKRRLA
jgi:hypothetical protein